LNLITEIPLEFHKPLPNLEITEKETATLECEVNKPDQVALWKKNRDVITPGAGDWGCFTVEVDRCVHRLTVRDAKMEDASEFSCHIKDRVSTGRLTVEG
jgi:titin/obscurin-RhoGEF protein